MTTCNTYLSHRSQLIDVKRYVLTQGREKGIECIDIDNGKLRMIINVDRGFDIASLRYKGMNISYTNSNGICNYDGNYDTSVNLGFLMTCGLDNIGQECVVDGKQFLNHGRLNTVQAHDVSVSYDTIDGKQAVIVKGTVRQTGIFGEQLDFQRTISVVYQDPSFEMQDEIINFGFRDSYYALMYHFNVGYPMLSEDTTVSVPFEKIIPKNEVAKTAVEHYESVLAPQDNFVPQVLHHQLKQNDGHTKVSVMNNKLGVALHLIFSEQEFPYLNHWRMFQKGEYVMGVEPCVVIPKGREKILQESMPILKKQTSKTYHMKIVLEG